MEPKQIHIYQVLLDDVRVMRIFMDAGLPDEDASICFSILLNAVNRASSSLFWRPDNVEEEDLRTGKIVKMYRLDEGKEVV